LVAKLDSDKLGRISDAANKLAARFDAMAGIDAADPNKEDYPERSFKRTINTHKGSRLAEQVQKKSGSSLDMRYFTPHELQGMIKTAASAAKAAQKKMTEK
jgi:hypothetical protein